jgi:ribosome-binding ATPase YchF (GTP1/OBG family)
LFNALTHAGAEVTAYAAVTEKANVGMAVIADDRLDRLAALIGSKKITPAAIRVVDVPGAGVEVPGGLRQADALLAVLDGFSEGADPAADLEACVSS